MKSSRSFPTELIDQPPSVPLPMALEGAAVEKLPRRVGWGAVLVVAMAGSAVSWAFALRWALGY